MKQWIEDILTLCQRSGPQTALQLAAFLNQREREKFDATAGVGYVYVGKPEIPAQVVTKLRKQPAVMVEVVASTPSRTRGAKDGDRKRKLYMVSRKVEAKVAGQA